MYNNNDLDVGYINLLNIAFVQILNNPGYYLLRTVKKVDLYVCMHACMNIFLYVSLWQKKVKHISFCNFSKTEKKISLKSRDEMWLSNVRISAPYHQQN